MENKEIKCVERIRESYQEKKYTKLDELKDLNKKVTKPVKVFAYVFGSVGSLVLGFGMCIAMKVILENLMVLGIVIGLVGIFMVSINYFLYVKILASRKKKYARRIMDLSDELLNK